jgi:hypothetical protein
MTPSKPKSNANAKSSEPLCTPSQLDCLYLMDKYRYLDQIADIAFYIDMCFGFLSSYFERRIGEEITAPKLIAIHYIKGDFFIDFLSTIHFEEICRFILRLPDPSTSTVVSKLYSFFSFLKILKLVRIKRVPRILKSLNDTKETKASYCAVFLFIVLVLYLHIVACFLFFFLR